MTNPLLSRAERKAAHRAALRDAVPGRATLASGLARALGEAAGPAVAIVARRPNEYASSFPSEIVTCRLADGRELTVLCKYAAGRGHAAYGHRGNVTYEAAVYRLVLEPIGVSAPRWYGELTVPETGECGLVIEYAAGAIRMADAPDPAETLPAAARWIGRFHALNERRLGERELGFLARYDVEYCRQWARRTSSLTAGMRDRYPWVAPACERFAHAVEGLLTAPTIIHGEYAPKNTLLCGQRVCPVDWESAAVAPGEIDLASVTDGRWPEALVDESVREYAQARWPAGAPAAFASRLDLARLYWNFRWLGERPEWTTSERGERRIGYVRKFAERLGLL